MEKNAKLPVNYEVRSMCDELMARHFDVFEEMIKDSVRLMAKMSTEVEVAYKSEKSISFHLARLERKWLRHMTYVVYTEIIPYILHAGVFNEGNFLKEPEPDMFDADFLVLYENGAPMGYALYDSGVSSSQLEFVDTIYIDRYSAAGTDESLKAAINKLLDKTMERFGRESRAYKEYCPPITLVKAQEDLFAEIIQHYGWQVAPDGKQHNKVALTVYNR